MRFYTRGCILMPFSDDNPVIASDGDVQIRFLLSYTVLTSTALNYYELVKSLLAGASADNDSLIRVAESAI